MQKAGFDVAGSCPFISFVALQKFGKHIKL